MQKASQRGLKTYMTEQPCSVHKGESKLKAWEIREKNQQRAGLQFPEQNPHSVAGPGNIYIVTRGGYGVVPTLAQNVQSEITGDSNPCQLCRLWQQTLRWTARLPPENPELPFFQTTLGHDYRNLEGLRHGSTISLLISFLWLVLKFNLFYFCFQCVHYRKFEK